MATYNQMGNSVADMAFNPGGAEGPDLNYMGGLGGANVNLFTGQVLNPDASGGAWAFNPGANQGNNTYYGKDFNPLATTINWDDGKTYFKDIGGTPESAALNTWGHPAVTPEIEAEFKRRSEAAMAAQQPKGFSGIMSKYGPAIIASVFGGGALAAAGAAGGVGAGLGDAAIEAGMLGGPAATSGMASGLAGATVGSFAPGVNAVQGAFPPDAIESMINLQAKTPGNLTWTEAANAAGFSSPEAYLASQGFGGQVNLPGGVESRMLSSPGGLGSTAPFDFGNYATGAPSWLSKAATSIMGPGSGPFSTGKSIFDIGSGIYGLTQQQKQRKLAEQAFAQFKNLGDPYAAVRELQNNPGLVRNLPGYEFAQNERARGVARAGAASGSGGNEAIAQMYGTDQMAGQWYDREMANRMAAAQGQGNQAVNAAQVGNQAMAGANSLASSSLGSIGYGLSRLGGTPQPTDMYKQIIDRMFRNG